MKIPTLKGIIDRRILINYTVDKNVLSNYLPKPFRPKLVNGRGLVGICLIRLKNIRPLGFPGFLGIGSENAAHRMAVEWTENGETKQGVYIPRRDTNSLLNHWAGGRVFPGIHHLAKFDVVEENNLYSLTILSGDNNLISIQAENTKEFSPNSVFENLENASDFYKNGAIGYSPNKLNYDGMELKTLQWDVDPLNVISVKSSFFENEKNFPKGSVVFDNALLMRKIEHKWKNYKNSMDTL